MTTSTNLATKRYIDDIEYFLKTFYGEDKELDSAIDTMLKDIEDLRTYCNLAQEDRRIVRELCELLDTQPDFLKSRIKMLMLKEAVNGK